MNSRYERQRQKITLKFNITKLDAIIISLINNPRNKKFASNVQRLLDQLDPATYQNDRERDLRVYIIRQITIAILDKQIDNKTVLLNFIDFDGVYEQDATETMNYLWQRQLTENETALIDKQVTSQLRYGSIGRRADRIVDLVTAFQSENYTDLDEFLDDFCDEMDDFNTDLRSAREGFEDTKNEVSLGSDSFVDVLDSIIQHERNPGSRIKTGIMALNDMLNGGLEAGRVNI